MQTLHWLNFWRALLCSIRWQMAETGVEMVLQGE